MLLKAGAKVRQYNVQGLNTSDFLKSPSADICNILYSAGEDCIMAGGASRIVVVENPKNILSEKYSEPLFLMYMSHTENSACTAAATCGDSQCRS